LIHRLRDEVTEADDDGTLQILDAGVQDKRLLVQEAEFAQALTVMQREANTLSMAVRNLWDDKPLETLTKHTHEKATGTHGTIIGHITRRELLKHLSEEKLGAGLGNRFMFMLVERSKLLPLGGDPDVFQKDEEARLRKAINFGKQEREIQLSAQVEDEYGYTATELWQEVYAALSEGKRGLLGAVTSQAEAYVRRIATVYAVLDLSEEVKVAHLLAALAVWQYCEQSAYLIFRDRTGDRLADDLLEALKDAGEAGVTRSEIYELFGRNQRRNRIGAVLRDLKGQGRAGKRRDRHEGPGRPTERWFLAGA
jgi:hypothetical protein